MLLELFIRVVQLFILASNLTRSRGNELKISAFVSVALLCINIGEYEKLGKHDCSVRPKLLICQGNLDEKENGAGMVKKYIYI